MILVTVCIFLHSVSICDKPALTYYILSWVFVWYLPLVAEVILFYFLNKLKKHCKREIFYNIHALQWLFIKLDDNITV